MTLALIGFSDLIILWAITLVILLVLIYIPPWVIRYREEVIEERLAAERRAAEDRRIEVSLKQKMRAARHAHERTLVKLNLRADLPRCPLCRDEVRDEELCGGCNTQAHTECLAEMMHGKCPTIGCGKRVINRTAIQA